MDNIQMLQWVIGVGFGFNFALLLVIWNSIKKKNNINENINELKNKEKRMKEEYVKKLEDYVDDKDDA